jgi:hypothetical protein
MPTSTTGESKRHDDAEKGAGQKHAHVDPMVIGIVCGAGAM